MSLEQDKELISSALRVLHEDFPEWRFMSYARLNMKKEKKKGNKVRISKKKSVNT